MKIPGDFPTIWTIAYWYPPNFSGAARQAQAEQVEWVKQGYRVKVLAAGVGAALSLRSKNINLDGVLVNYLPVLSFPSSSNSENNSSLSKIKFLFNFNLTFLSFAIQSASNLLKFARKNDIVRFEGVEKYTIFPILMAHLLGIHTIIRMSLLGGDDPEKIQRVARRGQILHYAHIASFHLAESLVAICSGMLESCRKAGISDKKVISIPYSVDTNLFCPIDNSTKNRMRQKLGFEDQKQYIVFVGSAIERKGIDILVDAFVTIQKKLNNVELIVVGPHRFDTGPFYQASAFQKFVDGCKEKLKREKCDQFVHWIGEVENVQDYMKISDVFCLPSRQEGFGIVIIEAMSCGLPVVVSNLDGVTSDIIQSVSEGTIISGFESGNYAKALMRILADSSLSKLLGSRARERTLSSFSLDHVTSEWITLFQSMVA